MRSAAECGFDVQHAAKGQSRPDGLSKDPARMSGLRAGSVRLVFTAALKFRCGCAEFSLQIAYHCTSAPGTRQTLRRLRLRR